jgi:hypothetical protein
MLNTKLADALRFPLKLARMIALDIVDKAPLTVTRSPNPVDCSDHNVHGFGFKMRLASSLSPEVASLAQIVAYVDPAGGGINADETAYAVTAFLNGNIYLLDVGGMPGGYDKDTLLLLAQRLAKWKPNTVVIEKNMGFGAFREVFVPILHAAHKCAVEDDLVTGQKETRIIATLEPVIGRGALIVALSALEQDKLDCARYQPKDRQVYSLFFQLAKLTRERGALIHDDRADALEGAVRFWQKYLAVDQEHQAKVERERSYQEMIADPMGRHRFDPPPRLGKSLLSKYRR